MYPFLLTVVPFSLSFRMIGRKASQISIPPTSSTSSSSTNSFHNPTSNPPTPRKTSGSRHTHSGRLSSSEAMIPIPLSPVSVQSFKSAETSPTGVQTPTSTARMGDGAKPADDVEEPRSPTLPMTPKSPEFEARSPHVPSLSDALPRTEDRAAVEELLGTMKQMLGTLGATFDTLGEQTMKVGVFF